MSKQREQKEVRNRRQVLNKKKFSSSPPTITNPARSNLFMTCLKLECKGRGIHIASRASKSVEGNRQLCSAWVEPCEGDDFRWSGVALYDKFVYQKRSVARTNSDDHGCRYDRLGRKIGFRRAVPPPPSSCLHHYDDEKSPANTLLTLKTVCWLYWTNWFFFACRDHKFYSITCVAISLISRQERRQSNRW